MLMSESLIVGIVYSIFHEKYGPMALAWVSGENKKEIAEDVRDDVSMKVMNLSFRKKSSWRRM